MQEERNYNRSYNNQLGGLLRCGCGNNSNDACGNNSIVLCFIIICLLLFTNFGCCGCGNG